MTDVDEGTTFDVNNNIWKESLFL